MAGPGEAMLKVTFWIHLIHNPFEFSMRSGQKYNYAIGEGK